MTMSSKMNLMNLRMKNLVAGEGWHELLVEDCQDEFYELLNGSILACRATDAPSGSLPFYMMFETDDHSEYEHATWNFLSRDEWNKFWRADCKARAELIPAVEELPVIQPDTKCKTQQLAELCTQMNMSFHFEKVQIRHLWDLEPHPAFRVSILWIGPLGPMCFWKCSNEVLTFDEAVSVALAYLNCGYGTTQVQLDALMKHKRDLGLI